MPKKKKPKPSLATKNAFSRRGTAIVDLIGREDVKHDSEILMMERAIYYPEIHPTTFLESIKGYSHSQAIEFLKASPKPEWEACKTRVLNKITETSVKRHIDLVVEMQDQHIKASKLGLAKAIEMMAKLPVLTEHQAKILKKGEKRKLGLRSIDLINCLNSVEKAQQIYRRAIGLPNEGGGLQQVLEHLDEIQRQGSGSTNVQNNVTINIEEKLIKELSYDDVMEWISQKRQERNVTKALSSPSEEVGALEKK